MLSLLSSNVLLTLFLIISLGYVLGTVKVGGVKFGLAAVLFVALGFGAFVPGLELPELVFQLGLVLFVYALGVNSGATVLASLKGTGLLVNLLVIALVGAAALLVYVLHFQFGLETPRSVGMLAGALTSTPTLAGILDYIRHSLPLEAQPGMLPQPIIGYSIAYPFGVLGTIGAVLLSQKLWRVDFAKEAEEYGSGHSGKAKLHSATVRITNEAALHLTVDEIVDRFDSKITLGRRKHGSELSLALSGTHLALGDLIGIVGPRTMLKDATAFLGEETSEQLNIDRAEMDYRRIFVSNPEIAGMRLKDLNLPQQFGAVITRVRRGDVEFVPRGSTVLQPGDRVRVVTRRDHMSAISKFFGDSYKAVSEVDLVSVGVGITLGILLGLLPIPCGSGLSFKLGVAGGPLVVALILGAVRKTGPINWVLPYSASLLLNQIGLALFFAGVGVRAGHSLIDALRDGSGYMYAGGGAIVTASITFLVIAISHRVLKVPLAKSFGVVAGFQTQPSVLEFAVEQTGNDLPKIGFSLVYPVATITKILAAQLLFMLLS